MAYRDFSMSGDPKHPVRTALLWILALIAGLILAVFLLNISMNHSVQQVTETVTVQGLPNDLENWSILVISDLKGMEFGKKQSGFRQLLGGRSFSTIVLCGDMVGRDGNVQPLLDLLDLLPEDKPKLIIAGDTDPDPIASSAQGSLSVYTSWVEAAIAHGATLLDRPYCITRGKSRIWFVPEYLYSLDVSAMESVYSARLASMPASGLTADQAAERRMCEYQLQRASEIRELSQSITAKDVQVAVTHTPLTNDYVASMFGWAEKGSIFSLRSAALVLAGHYCGGGWCLPGGQPLYHSELGWQPDAKLVVGLDYLTGIPQYISPGLGSDWKEPLPGRLFNQPSIAVITLTSRLQ